jgi:hypothetical protein
MGIPEAEEISPSGRRGNLMALYDITLYTPGGLFLDTYEDVVDDRIWFPDKERPWLRFRDSKTGLEVKTTLPFLMKSKPKSAAEIAMENYKGH